MKTNERTHLFYDALLTLLGIGSAALGLESFLLPNSFIDGGVTGISLLVAEITAWPLSILIIVFNLPFIVMGWRQMGAGFAVRTALAIAGLATAVALFHFPVLTQDKLLTAVFGGFFLGAGIGLCIRGGCVIDGTEILALYLSRNSPLTMGDVILVINIVIFIVAAFVLGLERAMYSILTYLAAGRTVDFIIHGVEEYTGVTIVSEKNEDIRQFILTDMRRGVTIYKGERGMHAGKPEAELRILYTVVTRLEVTKLKHAIADLDPQAFVIEQSINDTVGGMIKKRPLH